MLLKLLYDFAHSRGLLDDLAFTPKTVRWIVDVNDAGELLGTGPTATGDDKRGKEFSCPQTTRPKVAGGVSEFLADGLTAVFGLDPDPETPMPKKKRVDRNANNARKCADFWRQIQDCHTAKGCSDLQALVAFKARLSGAPPFLRWGKSAEAKPGDKSAWWIRTAGGSEVRLGPDNFTFRVNTRLLLENEALRSCWRSIHAEEVATARRAFSKGLCLISGDAHVPLAPTHNPKIQGVPNTPAFGGAIVSFDKPAFSSYGFDQSLNAPASDEAATAYCVALNWLLDHPDHSVRLGQTTLCFWAKQTETTSGLFAHLLNRPDPQTVAQFIGSPWSGIDRGLARRDWFYAVALAGNAGRVVVRHWLQATLEAVVENFRQWFSDLELFVPPRPEARPEKRHRPRNDSGKPDKDGIPPLAVKSLAGCTAPLARKAGRLFPDHDKVQPDVHVQIYRAALECTAPSTALLKPILAQLHSRLVRDEHYNLLYDETRFALLKLILNRNRKEDTMEIKPKLTADTDDPAYNCGRLLAVIATAQDKAHDYRLEGAGVAERYFGTASVSPASVFPLLLRLNRHHLNKISKSDRFAGHERFLQEQMQGILALFKPMQPGKPPVFPRTLDLQAQGRFALGFFQQSAHDDAARKAARSNPTESPPE